MLCQANFRFPGLLLLAVLLGGMLVSCSSGLPVPSVGPDETLVEGKDTVEPTTTPEQGASPGQPGLLVSEVQRDLAPQVSLADLEALAADNTTFALDLYHTLRSRDENLFYSPYSISLALAMTYAGARGDTERQMADTLHFTLPQERLHPAFNALDLALASHAAATTGEGEAFRLNIANAIWGQQGYPFRSEFLDVLAKNYGAGLRLADFVSDPDGARQTINEWVSEQTEDKIKDLIPPGAITDLTRLVLSNAIYFNAQWMHPFSDQLTEDGVFTLLDGAQVTVPMMRHTDPQRLNFTRGDGYQAIELPYQGGQMGMVILVPEAGQFEAFEDSLTPDRLSQILSDLAPQVVALQMPRFEYDSTLSLADTLQSMGMQDAFNPGAADFSAMDGTRDLYISDVFHKAFVSVDEKGTEAAAATAVIVSVESISMPQVELMIDRPFIFLIRDLETSAILFIGRVLNPA